MILKKFPFPIFILLLITTLLFSCSKQKKELTNKGYYNFINKAYFFYSKQEYDSAFFYYDKAKLSCHNTEKDRKSYALYYMADIQNIKCDFSGSEATLTELLKYNPNYPHINSVYVLLGNSYNEKYEYEYALKYFTLFLKNSKKEIDKCIVKNNIAYTYLKTNKYNKAIKILKPLTLNDSLIADKLNYAKVLDNLGFAYFKINDSNGIKYLNQSLTIRDSIKNDSEIIASYIHLADYYKNSAATLANHYAQKAYLAATHINSPNDRIIALNFLIATGTGNNTKKMALKQISLSDSINKIKQMDKNQFAKIKYDSKKAIEETEKQKEQKKIYFLLFTVTLIISILAYFLVESRNKRKLLKSTYETEIRISKRLHDELANDVFNTLTFAETQDLQDPEKKEFLLENLDTIYARTRNIAKENSDINTDLHFKDNLLSMIASYITNNITIITKNTNGIDWLKVSKENKIAFYRVIQELLVNMRKHSQCSIVIIGFETNKNSIEVNYSDNGIGTSEMLKFKNGLQNAENRILAIKGSLTFETETNKGFKAKIICPK